MIYQFGDYTLDTARNELCGAGEVINTGPQVLVVLGYLLKHRDRVVSRDELLRQCWPDRYVSDATLTSCLRWVRQAIGQTRRGPTLIETQHRRGYRFIAEVSELVQIAPARPDVETSPLVTPDAGSETLPTVKPEAIAPDATHLAPLPALPPEAVALSERRRLTVLSCTLADAERLTQQLDPEDYYDLMQTFRATALAIITPHDGYVASQVGNELLVYFGYPQAHEDDAQRAVRSGLALVEALGRVGSAGYGGDQRAPGAAGGRLF